MIKLLDKRETVYSLLQHIEEEHNIKCIQRQLERASIQTTLEDI